MYFHFFKLAIRNILKDKFLSFIEISGLALGISSFILIFLFMRHEKSYDSMYINMENIYRLRYERTSEDGESVRFASCCPPAAIRIRELYPEVKDIARIFRYRATVIFGDRKFYEDRMYFAEPQIFNVFNLKFITGDPLNGISNANCAFISEKYCKKYFGEKDPIGQTINVDREMSFVITGIFKDLPGNSHLKFDILLSWPNLLTHYGRDIEFEWGHTGFYTYFVLNPGIDPNQFEKKLKILVDNDFGEVLRQYKLTCDLKVQPLSDIHLKSDFMQEMEENGNYNTVIFLNIIAFFILIIAWVNYINLTTARSLTRANEVGQSKAVGASRSQLMRQFFLETILINGFAFVFSLGIIIILLPVFYKLTGISSDYIIWIQPWFWLVIITLFISSVLLSGIYPVLVLTSFRTSEVLKSKYSHSRNSLFIRKSLVVFQLFIAICLVICTINIYRQLRFLQSRDKGVVINDILAVRAPRIRDQLFGTKLIALREELLKNRLISGFGVGTEVPGRQILWDAGGIFRVGSDQSKNYQIIGIDYDYLDLLQAKIIAGRNFDRSFSSDSSSLLLNEKAVKWMGFRTPDEAVGKFVNYWDKIYSIVGVVKDYRQQSPKKEFEPHIFRFMPHGRDVRGFFMMKLLPGSEEKVLKVIEETFYDFFPDNPFDYFFLEDYYNQQFRAERLLVAVFAAFALLSLIVTFLGIFGLTYFLVIQKAREISIRRVLGSDIPGIILLFSGDFILITVIAFIGSVPVCYYWLSEWMKTFESKPGFSLLSFLIPFILVLILTILTTGILVYKNSTISPAENLRNE